MKMDSSREALWLLEGKYAGVESPAYFEDLERLEEGEPLAYIIGWVPFADAKIHLDSHPLIPRPETEYWVMRAASEIERAVRSTDGLKILDLCAGSGAIGIALLMRLKGSVVDFAEIDRVHHITILKNLTENNIDMRRTHIVSGDLFEKVEGTYDYIFSNPPYIDPALAERVEQSVIEYEPSEALWGGKGGVALIERLIGEAWGHLVQGGIIFIEHEPEQIDAIMTTARQCGYADGISLKDQYGTPRVTALQKP